MHLVMVGGILAAATGLALGTEWPVWVDLAIWVWAILFGVLNYATGKPEDRDRIVGFMTRVDGPGLYTRAVDGLLRLLGRMMAPKVRQGPLPEKGFARLNAYLDFKVPNDAQAKTLMKDPFSWPVANVALKLAIIYPLLSLLLQWGATNADTGVGGQTIIAGDVPWYWRGGITIPLVLGLVLSMLASATPRRSLRTVAEWLLTVAVAGAFAGASLLGWATETGRGRVGFAIFWSLGTAFVIGAIAIAPRPDEVADFRPLIFAFALLPLLNAAFDYLSYGTTLTLIRKGWFGQRGPSVRIAVLGAIDAAMALVFLVGLGVTLVAFVALINTYAVAGPLFDLSTVFVDLRNSEARGAYAWLILSCLTTLVPTIVHLLIVALSVFTWVPLRIKLWLARPVTAGDGDLPVLGSTLAWSVMGLIYCAAVAGGIAGLAWLARGGIAELGFFVLDCV